MKYVMISPVSNNMDALFVGIREFPTERVILLTSKDTKNVEKAKKDLERFKIPVQIKETDGDVWEGTFKAMAEIKQIEKNKELIVNVSTGQGSGSGCAICSASFVNGLRAFSVVGDKVMLLPILKFNYFNAISDKKMAILKELTKPGCCESLEAISKKTKMSLPLISYHINGTLKSQGLKELGLIETKETKGKVHVELSTMGRLLLKGYIE